MTKLKIVADSAIPFLDGVLDPWADMTRIPGKEITHEDVKDADVLIVRTRTRCDAALLGGTKVKFVATATIGFDHIDLEWCRNNGVGVSTSAGCNARGVLQWVAAVLHHLSVADGWRPGEKTLGIVGVGHVGSLVKEYAERWGFRVLCCDPPREEREGLGFLPLEELAPQVDFLTFHTPFDATTRHLGNAALFATMKPGAVVMNSSRGAVVDGEALLASGLDAVLDVWEHEPDIDVRLLEKVRLATSHIAGYSIQGKAHATELALKAVCEHFLLPLKTWYPAGVPCSDIRPISWEEMSRTIGDYYDIEAESRYLKSHKSEFERIRDNYAYREEYF